MGSSLLGGVQAGITRAHRSPLFLSVSPQSVFTLGAAAGGLSAMLLNDRLGRKLSIMFSAVPSAVGYALLAGAQGIEMLLLGRVLTGYAGGVTSASIPVKCPWREFAKRGGRMGAEGGAGVEPGVFSSFGGICRASGLRLGMGRMHPRMASLSCSRAAGLFLPTESGRQVLVPCPVPPRRRFLHLSNDTEEGED